MSLRRKAAALTVAATAAATLAVSATPAAAANHWGEGLGSGYPGHRETEASTTGAWARNVHIYWDGYRVGVKGEVVDTKGDGLGARAQVSYWYWDGNSWEWTKRNLVTTRNGQWSSNVHSVHSLVKVKYLKVRACTVTWTSVAHCGGWN